jgi:hypothetical protein
VNFPGVEVQDSARVDHRLSTTNRGSILPAERGNLIGRHSDDHTEGGPTFTTGRHPNSFIEPADYEFGRTGEMAGNDPCTCGEDGR